MLEHVRNRVMANLRSVDEDLATRVANGLNIDLPAKSKAAVEPEDIDLSPALRIVGKYPESLLGRWVGILVTDGADGRLVKAVRKAAEGEGATVKIVAPKVGGVTLKDGSKLKADGYSLVPLQYCSMRLRWWFPRRVQRAAQRRRRHRLCQERFQSSEGNRLFGGCPTAARQSRG